jgi:inner membrane transporter RhtA
LLSIIAQKHSLDEMVAGDEPFRMTTVPVTASRPAVLMVLGSCASLQLGAALAAHLFPITGSAGATLLRLGLAALLLVVLVRPAVHLWRLHQWRAVVSLGVCMAGMNGFFYAAIARIPVGPAVTIEFLGPLLVAALMSRRLRHFGWVALAGCGVALFGFGDGPSALDPLGVLYILIAAVFWGGYILLGAKAGAAVKGYGGLAVAMTVASLVLLPIGMHGAEKAIGSPQLILFALGTGILASALPYALEMTALRRLPQRTFGILLSLEPAFAAVSGWFLLGQHLSWLSTLAIALVVLASIGSTAFA